MSRSLVLLNLMLLSVSAFAAITLLDADRDDPRQSRKPSIPQFAAVNTQDSDPALPVLPEDQKSAIAKVLQQQVQSWNNGDIPGFMDGYWKTADLTFASGGDLTRGWNRTLERYQTRYDTREKMGNLTFDHLEYHGIADGAALVLGQWHLKNAAGELMEGNFSLVMKRFPAGWKVVHDHTSLKPKEDDSADQG